MKNNTFWLNYFRPTYFFENISAIDIDKLFNDGYRTILCDLDNTLAPHFSKHPIKITIDFIKKINSKGMKIFIFSNNTKKRVTPFIEKISKFCRIDGFMYSSKKPLLRKTKKFIKNNNIRIQETIIIGDQFITDIFIANRLKTRSILVTPLLDVKIGEINFIQRFIEKYLYKKIRQSILEDKNEQEKCRIL